MTLLMGLIFVAIGLFAVLGGATGWSWYMTHRKVEYWVSILGTTGARALNVLLGFGMMALGAFFITAWVIWEHPP